MFKRLGIEKRLIKGNGTRIRHENLQTDRRGTKREATSDRKVSFTFAIKNLFHKVEIT